MKHTNKHALSAAYNSTVTIMRDIETYRDLWKNGLCKTIENAHHSGWTQENRPNHATNESWLRTRYWCVTVCSTVPVVLVFIYYHPGDDSIWILEPLKFWIDGTSVLSTFTNRIEKASHWTTPRSRSHTLL